jgi:hypothetical protein
MIGGILGRVRQRRLQIPGPWTDYRGVPLGRSRPVAFVRTRYGGGGGKKQDCNLFPRLPLRDSNPGPCGGSSPLSRTIKMWEVPVYGPESQRWRFSKSLQSLRYRAEGWDRGDGRVTLDAICCYLLRTGLHVRDEQAPAMWLRRTDMYRHHMYE